jgi:superfamily I DNA/RNA helicase
MNQIRPILEDIVKQIKSEEDNNPLEYAIGRAELNHQGMPEKKVFWIFKSEYRPGYGPMQLQRHVHDRKVGHFVSKNSKLGELIISRSEGIINTNNQEFHVEFLNLSIYNRSTRPNLDALNGSIEMIGNESVQFRSAKDTLGGLVQVVEEETEQLEFEINEDIIPAEEFEEAIRLKENEYLSRVNSMSRYILESTQLRMKHILDEIQDYTRRRKILNGTIILDGGPGTGKTSTLIQRIKFLIDDTISQYSEEGGRILTELKGPQGWIFFSPSPLLAGFLKHAMVEEGLLANNNTTKVWSNYLRNELLRNYSIVGERNRFLLSTDDSNTIIPNNSDIIKEILKILENSLIESIVKEFKGILQITDKILLPNNDDLTQKKRINLIKDIRKACFEITGPNSIESIYSKCEILKNKNSTDFSIWQKEITNKFNQKCNIILYRIRQNNDQYEIIRSQLPNAGYQDINTGYDLDDEVTIPDNALGEDSKIKRFIHRGISHYIQKNFLNKYEIPETFTCNNILLNYFNELFDINFSKEWMILKSLTNAVSGGENKVFSKLIKIYREFRGNYEKILDENGFFKQKENANQYFNNKINSNRLNYDEMNLIILFINTLISKLQLRSLNIHQSKNQFVTAYLENQRYIIAIDEASDFSLLELLCMRSLGHPKYESVSISGDIMQRMTLNGVNNWDEYQKYVPNTEVFRLNISYRQSPTLTRLAKRLYEIVTGNIADFRTSRKAVPEEPLPVYEHISNSEEKVSWISNRILEIYETYNGNIPSIAIFTPNVESANKLANELRENGRLSEMGINIRTINADNTNQEKGTIGVYDIRLIKGMEFEAVFFIDIDLIGEADESLLLRYIYVGVSRSAYYLFITYSEHRTKLIDKLKELY